MPASRSAARSGHRESGDRPRHLAKVYGKAAVGSPPMSVPHLDTRYFGGKQDAAVSAPSPPSPQFLKEGSYFDLPKSVTLDNFRPMLAVGWDDFALVEYLAGQLMLSDKDRMDALREYLPKAQDGDWRLWQAGQRVQIIKRDPEKGGVLKLGTERSSPRRTGRSPRCSARRRGRPPRRRSCST